jgi:hypothetical protein
MMRLQAVRSEGEGGDAFMPSSIGWVVVALLTFKNSNLKDYELVKEGECRKLGKTVAEKIVGK